MSSTRSYGFWFREYTNCLLCDEPLTTRIFGSYEVPDGRIHDRCLYALIRRELSQREVAARAR